MALGQIDGLQELRLHWTRVLQHRGLIPIGFDTRNWRLDGVYIGQPGLRNWGWTSSAECVERYRSENFVSNCIPSPKSKFFHRLRLSSSRTSKRSDSVYAMGLRPIDIIICYKLKLLAAAEGISNLFRAQNTGSNRSILPSTKTNCSARCPGHLVTSKYPVSTTEKSRWNGQST